MASSSESVPVFNPAGDHIFVPAAFDHRWVLEEYRVWRDFARAARRTTAPIIVVARRLDSHALLPELRSLQFECPHIAVILVTARDADNIRLTAGFLLQDIVWIDRAASDLPPALSRARNTGCQRNLLAVVRKAARNTKLPAVANALLFSDPPVRSVKGLARVLDVHRHTIKPILSRHGVAPHVQPKHIIDLFLLFRGICLRSSGLRWAEIQVRLMTPRQRLERIARRITGAGLIELLQDPAPRFAVEIRSLRGAGRIPTTSSLTERGPRRRPSFNRETRGFGGQGMGRP